MGNKAKNRKKEELKIEQSTQALFRNGVRYFETSNYADAIEVWERANKKLSTPQLKEALTETYFRQGVVNNDEQSLLRSAELAPQDARVYYYLGRFYAQTDLVASERYYQRTIELGGELKKSITFCSSVAQPVCLLSTI